MKRGELKTVTITSVIWADFKDDTIGKIHEALNGVTITELDCQVGDLTDGQWGDFGERCDAAEEDDDEEVSG